MGSRMDSCTWLLPLSGISGTLEYLSFHRSCIGIFLNSIEYWHCRICHSCGVGHGLPSGSVSQCTDTVPHGWSLKELPFWLEYRIMERMRMEKTSMNDNWEWRRYSSLCRWDGTRDLHIGKWELGMDYTSVVESFNVGTNTFAKKYVFFSMMHWFQETRKYFLSINKWSISNVNSFSHLFRRMRWMNSKMGAQFATLMYLAIWHGYHLGYFLLFIFEMACMLAQEQV